MNRIKTLFILSSGIMKSILSDDLLSLTSKTELYACHELKHSVAINS